MTNREKDRLCAVLKDLYSHDSNKISPDLSLRLLAQEQLPPDADISGLLNKVETFRSHLYEASQTYMLEKVRNIYSREEIFHLAVVPFIIAELVWDYADTMITTASALDCRATRQLSRAVRQLKTEYDRIRYRFITPEQREREIANYEVFEEAVAHHARQLNLHIGAEIDNETLSCPPDWRLMYKAVYQCYVMSSALIQYSDSQRVKASRRINGKVGAILPREFYAFHKLILEFLGDLKPSKRFRKTLETYIRTFAAQMARIEYNIIPEP